MKPASLISAEEKIQYYVLALQLYNEGKSHPQIVELLNAYIDSNISKVIADKAFNETWDKLHQKAARRLSKGVLWNKVVKELSVGEPYTDVVEWLVNDLYLRHFEILHEQDKFENRFKIWGYLLVMGLIQLIRYVISPYNKIYFWISMLVGFVGLCWGIWDFFFDRKNDYLYQRFSDYEQFRKKMEKLSRIELLFVDKKKKVLNVYCTAGYPQLKSTIEVMKALQENGADIIELGMPYSDPLADGPVIQQSSSIAIANGMTLEILFEQLKEFRKEIQLPVVLMGYMNPVLQYGFEQFCKDAAAVGVDGLILPDLPEYEFETEYGAIIKQYGLDFIFLVTPETSDERIQKLDSLSTGFLYAVSSSSTTGSDKNMTDVDSYLQKLQSMHLKNPVLVGFGIKDKESFDKACAHANGAIIGSAYIKALEGTNDVAKTTKEFLNRVLK